MSKNDEVTTKAAQLGRRITSKLLRQKGACSAQIELFVSLGGDRLELTEALCLEHASKFDWNWAALNLLSRVALAEYKRIEQSAWAEYERIEQSALTEYKRVEQPAWAEYASIERPAWGKYKRIQQSAWAEYERIEQSARAEYERIKQPARAEYERAQASAFFLTWVSPKNQRFSSHLRSLLPWVSRTSE